MPSGTRSPYFQSTIPSRNAIPRTSSMPMDIEFASYNSQVSQPEMSHFSLSSSQPRGLCFGGQMYGNDDYYPGVEGSLPLAVSGDLMSSSVSMADLSPMDSVFDFSTGNTSPPWDQSELYLQSEYVEHNAFAPMHMAPATPLSPPPEEAAICEHLGVSKLQAYSKPRRQPRLLRPSNERTSSQDSEESATSSPEDSTEKAKARSDPLYDMKPDKDGFYHCPKKTEWSNCKHEPTRQKCIFAKYLDSHLRPYICRHASAGSDCEDLRFSSNACLFRHEREAHGMHSHGHNPYPCEFRGCERAKPGNGFPRRWNQRDHMKRVHGLVTDSQHGAGRRRAAPSSVPMRRSGSGGRPRGPQPYHKDSRPSMPSRGPQMMYAVPEYSLPVTDDMELLQYPTHPQAMYYPQSVY